MRTELNPAEKEMTTAERLRVWSDDPDLPPLVAREMREASELLERARADRQQEGDG